MAIKYANILDILFSDLHVHFIPIHVEGLVTLPYFANTNLILE